MTDDHSPFDSQDGSGTTGGLVCVELEFATLRRFREEMAPYLNYDGFFARSERPLPRGTSVEFKFVMPEDFILAQGTAVVAWTIEQEKNPDLVPGMALRFVEVGRQSRAVIDELVDFQIATGGDPFDLGPAPSRAGEFPTDALGGGQREPSPFYESREPTVQDISPLPIAEATDVPVGYGGLLDVPAENEALPDVSSGDEVLPDWLSGSKGQDQFSFEQPPAEPKRAPEISGGFDASIGPSSDSFDADMIFGDKAKDSTPIRSEAGSFHQMAMAPKADHKPPRDLRLGLIVTLAIVLVAVVGMALSYWMKKDDREVDLPSLQGDDVSQVGVVLVEEIADGELAEPVPDESSEGVAEIVSEAGSGLASESVAGVAGERESEPQDRQAASEVGNVTAQTSPTKVFVTENPPEDRPPATGQAQASRVVDVVATARAGATTVVIRGNGRFGPSALRTLRLDDPDRLWVSVSPIETFYRPNEIEVNSPEVHQVRIGYHPEDNPPALYVVLDLAGADVDLLETSVEGDAIRLMLGRK